MTDYSTLSLMQTDAVPWNENGNANANANANDDETVQRGVESQTNR